VERRGVNGVPKLRNAFCSYAQVYVKAGRIIVELMLSRFPLPWRAAEFLGDAVVPCSVEYTTRDSHSYKPCS
jgi:hypothetical protein